MKKVYFIVILLVVLGAVASYYLMPSDNEVSFVVYKEQIDNRYGEVEANYRKRIENGEVTAEVVGTLVKLYLESASIDKAIEVMELFVNKYPANIDARTELGQLYQYAQRPDDYLRNLEEINAINSNSEILKTLSDIYNFNEEYEKQADVLKQLLSNNEQLDPKQVVDLANILAANDKSEDAISTLQQFIESNPENATFPAVELLSSLLMDSGEYDKSYAVINNYRLSKNSKVEDVARLVNILHFKGAPSLAQNLLDTYGDEVHKTQELLYEQVLLYVAFGKDDEAHAVLSRLYAEDNLPSDLFDSYILLALKRDDDKLVKKLATDISEDNVDEAQAISLTEIAVDTKRNYLLNIINKKLGSSVYRTANPLFDVVLGLALREKNISRKITPYIDGEDVTDSQRLVVARSCAKAKRYKCADDLLGKFVDGDSISNQKLAAAGFLYIDMKRFKQGYDFVAKHRQEGVSMSVDKVWVKLSASQGKKDDVIGWMGDNKDMVQYDLLSDIYFLSYENRHYSLASHVAEQMYDENTNSNTRSYLANAYIKTGKFSQALALLEQNKGLSQADADSYLSALILQAGRDPSYRSQLGDFAAKQLASPMSEKRKLSIIYALIDAGRLDIAMPYVKEYAMKKGGDWIYIYADNLDRQGKTAEAREFWLKLASQPNASDEVKRNIAYALMEKGYFEDATGLFIELSAGKPADSKEVSQLLYLWGPRLNGSQLNWLYSQANAATSSADKQKWLSFIAEYSSAENMLSFVDKNPDSINNKTIFSAYLQSLYDLRKSDELVSISNRFGSKSDNTLPAELLRDYAHFANDNNIGDLGYVAYKKLNSISPNDTEALREIGFSSYNKSDYSDAELYIGNYLQKTPKSKLASDDGYLANFYYAELLRRDKSWRKSKKYYGKVIKAVNTQPNLTVDMESKKAQSMIMLGQDEKGFAYYDALTKRYPHNSALRDDMISLLIEKKQYARAEKMLADSKSRSSEVSSAATPLRLGVGGGFKAYRMLSNRREVLLATDPKIKQSALIIKNSPLSHEWISYTTSGYDKTLVVAKPAWQLEVVNSGNGEIIIVPTRDVKNNAATEESQQYLRHQLMAARIELETDRQDDAVARLNKMSDDYANDAQYLGYLANVENYVGRWSSALKLLNRAENIAPRNEDIADLKHGIERLYSQHIKVDHEWRQLGDHDEQITTLEGFATIGEGLDLGAVLQNNHVDSAILTRANGTIGQFNADRQRGEIFIRKTKDDGSELKGSIYANNDTAGAGVSYGFINWLGKTTMTAEYHRPYWEFVEGVLDDATRDRLAAHHAYRLNGRTVIIGGVGVNRYNVENIDNVVSTVSVEANVAYELSGEFAERENLSVIYGLDAEYELSHKERLDGGANLFRPLPLRSRETHSLALAGRHDFTRRTNLEWLGGYAFDRLGGHGPIGEARLTHEITDNLEFQARASIGVGNGETDDDLKRVGAYLMYRY